MAAVVGSAAVVLAAGKNISPAAGPATESQPPVVQAASAESPQLVTSPIGPDTVRPAGVVTVADVQPAASRWRVVEVPKPQLLPKGIAPEQGLQVRTIFVARSLSVFFPEIQTIAGVRPDALRWHPNGLALDVMIPNPMSSAGIALGDRIVSFVLQNAKRFGIQDAIWRDTYYTPGGAQGGGYGHYDHVHITTTGGGYPTGDESYYR